MSPGTDAQPAHLSCPLPAALQAQIRQQLSPMFRLSEALLGAEQNPQGAAEALDAATGLSSNGFELLARRPGSRGGIAGTAAGSDGGAAARPQARQQRLLQQSGVAERGGPRGSAALAGGRQHEKGGALLQPGSAAAAVQHTLGEVAGHEHAKLSQDTRGKQTLRSMPKNHARLLYLLCLLQARMCLSVANMPAFPCRLLVALPPAPLNPLTDASAILGSTDEVDSLVANARAAAARAQSALAELESPPRAQHQQHRHHAAAGRQQHTGKEAACLPAAEGMAAGSALLPAAPLPYAQPTVSAGGSGPAVAAHRELGLQASQQQPLLPVDGAEAHAWVDRLRQRSEDLIRRAHMHPCVCMFVCSAHACAAEPGQLGVQSAAKGLALQAAAPCRAIIALVQPPASRVVCCPCRTECERLVASMHLLFDDVWAGLQQELGQQREEAQRLQQQHLRQQEQLQQGPEPDAGEAASLEGSITLAAEDAGYGESLQQALDPPASQQDDDARSGTLGSSTSVHSEAGGAAWPAQEHELHSEQLGGKQMQSVGRDGASGTDNGNTVAFQFSLRGQHMQQQEGQRAPQPACTGDGSLPAGQQLPQAAGAGFVGFGSPIRVLPSPAKPAAGGRAPSRLQFAASEEGSRERAAEQADSWTADSSHGQEDEQPRQAEQQQLRLDEQHQLRLHAGSTAEQAARAGFQGQAAADEEQATPALRTKAWPGGQRALPTGLDPYHTACSIAAPASEAGSAVSDAFDSPRSPAAGSEGGASSSSGGAGSSSGGLFGGPVPLGTAGGASPAPQHVPPAAAATSPLLGAGRKDLDSIVGSIRRLAAEMRWVQVAEQPRRHLLG